MLFKSLQILVLGFLSFCRNRSDDLGIIWTDFLSAQGLVETAGGAARAGGKRQPARCSRKTQDKFAIASMEKSFCIVAYARMHESICIFCGGMHF